MTTKICTRCHLEKSLEEFHRQATGRLGRMPSCKMCRSEYGKRLHKRPDNIAHRKEYMRQWAATHTEYKSRYGRKWYTSNISRALLYKARRRAEKLGLPFDLSAEDVVVPETCPVLGYPISIGTGRMGRFSPTLDRLKPELGYVKGNVLVVSNLANQLKSDASVEDIEKVLSWVKSIHKSR